MIELLVFIVFWLIGYRGARWLDLRRKTAQERELRIQILAASAKTGISPDRIRRYMGRFDKSPLWCSFYARACDVSMSEQQRIRYANDREKTIECHRTMYLQPRANGHRKRSLNLNAWHKKNVTVKQGNEHEKSQTN